MRDGCRFETLQKGLTGGGCGGRTAGSSFRREALPSPRMADGSFTFLTVIELLYKREFRNFTKEVSKLYKRECRVAGRRGAPSGERRSPLRAWLTALSRSSPAVSKLYRREFRNFTKGVSKFYKRECRVAGRREARFGEKRFPRRAWRTAPSPS